MKKPWLSELRRLVQRLEREFKANEINKDSPFGQIVAALIQLVGIRSYPPLDPKPETVKGLAEAACCADMHIAFVCSTDEKALRRVISSLKLIVSHIETYPREIIAV